MHYTVESDVTPLSVEQPCMTCLPYMVDHSHVIALFTGQVKVGVWRHLVMVLPRFKDDSIKTDICLIVTSERLAFS